MKQRLNEFFADLPVSERDAEAPNGSVRLEDKREAFEAEVSAAADRGDLFTVGALFAKGLAEPEPEWMDQLLAKVTGAWASTRGMVEVRSLQELSERMESFAAANLASSFINALALIDDLDHNMPRSKSSAPT